MNTENFQQFVKDIFGVATAALLAVGLAVQPAAAQSQGVSVEVRGGLNAPLGDFDEAGAESEAGYGADIIFSVTPAFSIYGGWARDQFQCDGCDADDDLYSSGFEAGVKLMAPREEGVLPWLRVGAQFHKLTGEFDAIAIESDRGLGLQASAGLDIPLGEVLSVSPAIRLHDGTATFDGPFGIFEAEAPVRYISFDLGAHFHVN